MAMQLAGRRVALAVGIIVLAVGTVAIISFIKQRGESTRHNEITKVADERLKQLEEETKVATNQPEKQQGTNADPAPQSSASPEVATPPAASAEELPQTGFDGLAVAPLAILAFALASYVNSRRLLRAPLTKPLN